MFERQTRRTFLKTLAGTAMVISHEHLFSAMTSSVGAKRPAIVIFLADDHGYWDSSVYGSTDVRTPGMQRLADDGLTFTNAFVASPSCAPSRAAMLTGLMPARNGAEANHTYPRPGVKQLPAYLQRLGYEVAAFGKISHGAEVNARDAGFDHVNRMPREVNVGAIERYLQSRDSQQDLCLFVGSSATHILLGPWPKNEGYDPNSIDLPPSHYDTAETREYRTRYLSGVNKLDRQIDQTYALARRVFGDNMVFIYSSDHGAQWPFGKWNLYDQAIRTPLMVTWPGVIPPGRKTEAMVSWADFLPTLIEIAGGAAPADLDGKSFLPVLKGTKDQHRDAIFTTHSSDHYPTRMNAYPIRSIRTDRFKYILNLRPDCYHTTHIDLGNNVDGLRYWYSWVKAAETDPLAKQIVDRYHIRPKEELYDVRSDPFELNNLAALPQHQETLHSLRRRLEEWMEAQGDKQQDTAEPYPRSQPKPVSDRLHEISG